MLELVKDFHIIHMILFYGMQNVRVMESWKIPPIFQRKASEKALYNALIEKLEA